MPKPTTPMLTTARAIVMGVVNVTPDSFSDGGQALDVNDAIALGRRLAAEGADIVDVGGESTRPGAQRVPAAIENERVIPVISELARAGIPCSVDTTRASVASAALDAGAVLVNDVSAGRADPDMASLIAAAGVPWIIVHSRGPSSDMDTAAHYQDVVAQVHHELMTRVEAAVVAGINESLLVLDPGLGFAKTAGHNWAILRALPLITGLEQEGWGFPVLIGASRKRFLGELLGDATGPRPISRRDDATTSISALSAAAGVWGVRVHSVASSVCRFRVNPDPAGPGGFQTSSQHFEMILECGWQSGAGSAGWRWKTSTGC